MSKISNLFSFIGVKKFENSILKMYLVNAVFNNKAEKITEFFKLMTPELQNQNEWKEWFSKFNYYFPRKEILLYHQIVF